MKRDEGHFSITTYILRLHDYHNQSSQSITATKLFHLCPSVISKSPGKNQVTSFHSGSSATGLSLSQHHERRQSGFAFCLETRGFLAPYGPGGGRGGGAGQGRARLFRFQGPGPTQAHTPVTLAQDGKVSRLNIALPQLLMASVMHRIPMMFMTTPVFAWEQRQERWGVSG